MHPLFAHLLKLAAVAAATLATVVAIPAGVLFLLFFAATGPSADEVARATAPDGTVDAVLLETNGGATTSFGYEIHVVPHGAERSANPVATLYGAIRSERAYGANLDWESPSSLAVRYLSAKSANLHHSRATVSGITIQITLRAGETDASAPAGGMLYNLRRRP